MLTEVRNFCCKSIGDFTNIALLHPCFHLFKTVIYKWVIGTTKLSNTSPTLCKKREHGFTYKYIHVEPSYRCRFTLISLLYSNKKSVIFIYKNCNLHTREFVNRWSDSRIHVDVNSDFRYSPALILLTIPCVRQILICPYQIASCETDKRDLAKNVSLTASYHCRFSKSVNSFDEIRRSCMLSCRRPPHHCHSW